VRLAEGWAYNPAKLARYPRTIFSDSSSRRSHPHFFEKGPKMPFFECKVSHTVCADDLQTKRVTENVYVEAKDGREAKAKAGHPRNWLRSAATFEQVDKSSSFLITVGECRRIEDDKAKALKPFAPAFAPA
jgi:hypothetical protein